MIYVCNAFSFHMLKYMPCGEGCRTEVRHISALEAGDLLRDQEFISFFGHDWTAHHLSRYLHVEIPVNRGKIQMDKGDLLLVASSGKCSRDVLTGMKRLPKWHFFTVKLAEDVHGSRK